MPELAYEYTSTLMNTIPLDANEIALIQFKNPITIKGRIAIINGTIILYNNNRIIIIEFN